MKKTGSINYFWLGLLSVILSWGTQAGAIQSKSKIYDDESSFKVGNYLLNNTAVVNELLNGEVALSTLGGNNPSFFSVGTMPSVLDGHKGVVYKDKLYILGDGTHSTQIYYWTVDVNGNLSSQQTQTMSQNNVLQNRRNYALLAYNSMLYVIGGNDSNGTALSDMWGAPINADGSIGNFFDYTTYRGANLGTGVQLKGLSAFFYKGKIVLVGGETASGINSKIYTNSIWVAGGVSNSFTEAASTAISVKSAAIAQNGRYVFVVGGNNGTNSVDTVYSINLDDYTVKTLTVLPEAREKSSIVIDKGNIYIIGGEMNGTLKQTIYVAPINPNGTIGSWDTASNGYISAIKNAVSLAYSGYILTFGGNSGAAVNTIARASIAANTEGLGSFSATGVDTLPRALYKHSVVSTGNFIYVLGGKDSGGSYRNEIFYATQNAQGGLSSWQTSGLSLPGAMSDFSSVISGDKLYILGGISNGARTSANYMTTINATTGALDSTWTALAPLPTANANHAAVTVADKVYVIGGSSQGSQYSGQVFVGTISGNGLISSWATTRSVSAVRDHEAVFMDNQILVVGGDSGSGAKASIYYQDVDAAGNLLNTTWQQLSGKDLTTPVRNFTTVAANNYLYVLGGENGSGAGTYYSNVYYIKKDAGVFQNWTANPVNLSTTIHSLSSAVVGTYVYVIGGNDGTNALSTVYKANLDNSLKYSQEGAYLSEIYDLGSVVTIDSLAWNDTAAQRVLISYDIASQNGNWAGFCPPESDLSITVGKSGRYLRYFMIATSNQTAQQYLDDVTYTYQAPEINVQAFDTTPLNITQNTKIIVASINMRVDAWSTYWNSLKVDLTGYTDIGTINILDSNFNPIATQSVDAASEIITLPQIPISSSATSSFYLRVEVNKSAVVNDSFKVTIKSVDLDSAYLGFQSPFVYKFDGFISRSDAKISKYTPIISVSYAHLMPTSSIAEADKDVPIEKLVISTDLHSASWNAMTLYLSGKATADIQNIYLYKDSGNGSYDGSDTLVGTVTAMAPAVTMTFVTPSVLSETPGTYFIVVDIQDEALMNDQLMLGWALPTDFVASASETVVASVNPTSVPHYTNYYQLLKYNAKVTIDHLTDELAAYGGVTQNSAPTVFSFQAHTDKNSALLDRVDVTLTGTSLSANVGEVRLYYDTPGDSQYLLGSTSTYNNKTASVYITGGKKIVTTPETFYLVYYLSPIATPNTTIGATIITSNIVFHPGYGQLDTPFAAQNTVIKTIGATSGDQLLYKNSQTLASGIVVQSDTGIGLFSLAVSTNQNAVALNTVSVYVHGTNPLNDVNTLSAYYKDILNNDIFLASANLRQQGPDVVCDIPINNFMIATPGATLVLKASLTDVATIGGTFNVLIDHITNGLKVRNDGSDNAIDSASVASNVFTIKKYPAKINVLETNNPLSHVEKNTEYLFQTYDIWTDSHTAFIDAFRVAITGNCFASDMASISVYVDNGNGIFGAEDTLKYSATPTSATSVTLSVPVQTLSTVHQKYFFTMKVAANAQDYATVGMVTSKNGFSIDVDSSFNTTFNYQSQTPTVDPLPSNLQVSAITIDHAFTSAQGDTNVAVMKLSVKMDTGEADWNTINIRAIGDVHPTTNIAGIRICKDNDNGSGDYSVINDTAISPTVTFNASGRVTIRLNAAEHVATTTLNYFVVFDISPYSNYGVTQGVQIASTSDIVLVDTRDKVVGTFPMYTSPNLSIDVATILVKTIFTDRASPPLSYTNSTLDLDSAHNVMGRLQMRASQKYTYWDALVLDFQGSLQSGDIAMARVYKDLLNNGVYNAGTEILLGSATLNAGRATININPADWNDKTILASASQNFFIVLDIADGATPNDTIRVNIANADSLIFSYPDIPSASFPMMSSSVAINLVTINATVQDVTPLLVERGTTYKYFQLSLSSPKGYAYWQSITLNRTGDAPLDSLDSVQIYRDPGGAGFDPLANDLIASTNWAAVAAKAITLDVPQYISPASSSDKYWIAIKVSDNAVPRKYIGLNFASTDLGFSRGVTLSSALYTTNETHGKVNDPPCNLLITNPVAIPIGGIFQGAANVKLMQFDLSVTPNWGTELSMIKIRISSDSGQDNDIKQMILYKENDNLAGITTGDVLLGTANVQLGVAEIPVSQLSLMITSSAQTLYVAADIDDLANPGAQYSFSIDTGNYFSISSKDHVPTLNLPISATNMIIAGTVDTLNVMITSSVSVRVTQDTQSNYLSRISVRSLTRSCVLNQIDITVTGNYSSTDFGVISLYQDLNGNVSWDAGSDPLVATATVLNGLLTFDTNKKVVNNTTTINYFLIMDVDRYATPNDTFLLQMGTSSFTLDGLYDVVGNVSYLSPTVTVKESVDVMQVSITEYTSSSNYKYYIGNTRVPVRKFGVHMNQHEGSWTGLRVLIEGSANSNQSRDVKRVAVYRDHDSLGSKGVFDTYDELIGETSLDVNQQSATINFTDTQNMSTEERIYFYVVDMDENATLDKILGFKTQATDFVMVSPDIASGSAPSYLRQITTLPSMLVINGYANVAPSEVGIGTTLNAIEKLYMSSNDPSITVQWLSLHLYMDGTADDSQISKIYLYKDNETTGNVGTFDKTDTPVITGSVQFVGREASLIFPTPEALISTPSWYYVVVDINPSASVGSQFLIKTTSVSDYGTLQPATVKPQFYNFQSRTVEIRQPRSLITATFNMLPTSNNTFYQADKNQVMGIFSIWTNNTEANINTLKLHQTGTLPDDKIERVSVYRDSDSNHKLDLTGQSPDLKLTTTYYQFAGGYADINFGSNAQKISGPTVNLLIVCDLASDVDPGSTVQFQIAKQSDFTGLGANDLFTDPSFDTAISPFPFVSPVCTINASADTVNAVMVDLNQTDLVPGTNDLPILKLSLATQKNFADLRSIKIHKNGDMPLAYISQLTVYKDNGDGVISAADTLVVSLNQAAITQDTMVLSLNTTERITTITKNFILAINLLEVDDALRTFGLAISANTDIRLLESTDFVTGSFSLSTVLSKIANTVDKVYLSQTALPSTRNVAQETTGYLLEGFGLSTKARFATFDKLILKKTGTLPDSYISNIQIFKDDGDKLFNSTSDTKISNGTTNKFVNGYANLTLQFQTLNSTTQNYFVVVDVADNAPQDGTCGAVAQNDDLLRSFSIQAPDAMDDASFSWTAHPITITRYPSVVQTAIASSVSGNLSTRQEFELMQITLSSLHNTATMKALLFKLQGEVQPSNFVYIDVYKENPAEPSFNPQTATLLSDIYFYINDRVVISENIVLDSTPVTLHIMTKFEPNNTSPNRTFVLLFVPTNDVVLNDEASVFCATSNFVLHARTFDERQPTLPSINYSSFSNKTNRLSFAYDVTALNGLSSISYAVGKTPGGTDVLNWQTIPIVQPSALRAVKIMNVTNDVTITNIAMLPGEQYYLSVKAMSTDGVWSDVKVSNKIMVDITPPSAPGQPNAAIGGINNDTIIISWGGSNDSESNIAGYELQMHTGLKPLWEHVITDNKTSYMFTPSPNFDTYYFKVRALNNAGDVSPYTEPSNGLTYGTDRPAELLSRVMNYPNPFQPDKEDTIIAYTLNTNAAVTIKIYDLFGNKVIDYSFSAGDAVGGHEGINDVHWDGRNAAGRYAGMGGYIALITADDTHKKVTLKRKIAIIR